MKSHVSPKNFFIFLDVFLIALAVVFYFTFTSDRIWNIATDGFRHTHGLPLYLQPWAWTSLLAFIMVVTLVLTHGGESEKMESDSEEGTTHE
ncbi:hypothetical protein [Rubrolithibacter danxiaensis]|uniref:hypothetical protein n=1 Tax=Rubrolithibacter danxiaensis TaxID=3390805 RepID=UPI003BF7EDC6